MNLDKNLQELAINTIRFLSVDGVQNANSGHPGMPMGAAAMAFTLWTRHLRFNPQNPRWPGRDRFILSGGHGSMLLYSLLHLTGFDLSLDDLKRFRQWGSKTPGHPEYGLTPGVEVTTGPLGQGFANGVGMAIAAEHLAAQFNRPGFPLFDMYIYAIVTDGDLMEGISSEAASLAGHLQLRRLIYLYDDNRISIDGPTDLAFTEERLKRFKAFHWHIACVEDGNEVEAIDAAISEAKKANKPSLIAVRTHIGYGLPTRQDTAQAHGEPPGEEELTGAKIKLGWPVAPKFLIPDEVRAFFSQFIQRGREWEDEWNGMFARYKQVYPELGAELERRLRAELPDDWDRGLPEFSAEAKGIATRVASGKVLNALKDALPELIGGSADLTPSTKTWLEGCGSIQKGSYQERNLHFGVREHAMGAIVNGMAVFGGLIPFGATFLVFSDYMRPAIRMSALSHYPSIWVFTHDSIGLGEDGPTHQPVEHLASLRAMPSLVVIRPADANEVREAWKVAIKRRHAPTALILSRQNLPILDRHSLAPAEGLQRGAYVLADLGSEKPLLILIASGSEVHLVLKAGMLLAEEGISSRIVSFPSWELFEEQDEAYQQQVLPASVPRRIAVEAGVPLGWERWVGDKGLVIGIERFGASAPYQEIYAGYGLTVERIVSSARKLCKNPI